MKLKAPIGWTGFSIMGKEYCVSADGTVTVDDDAAVLALIKDNGFTNADVEPEIQPAPVADQPVEQPAEAVQNDHG